MSNKPNVSVKYSKVNPTTAPQTQPGSRIWSFHRNRSLAWMLLALLSGVGFCIGHHFFYASFQGVQVDRVSIDQTWIIRIGTGFAFVAKTLLVVATSIAFVQHQWLALSRETLKIRQIDTMTGVLSNSLLFFNSRIWLHFPLLTILALVAWLLPIIAIVTPATIVVVARDNVAVLESTVPQLYLEPSFYANLQTLVRSDYLDPSPDTMRIAFGSAMTGQILPISQAQPNMSYILPFLAPALRCDPAEEGLVKDVFDVNVQWYNGIENEYRYLAWVPPTADDPANLSKAFQGNDRVNTIDLNSPDVAHIYIIPNTSTTWPISVSGIQITPDDAHYGYQDLIDCKLYNASYETLFNFTFPTQTIRVELQELLNPVNLSIDITDWHFQDGSPDHLAREAQRICYQSIMDAFGRLLVGYEWWRDGFVTTEKTSWNMLAIDWTSREETQRGLEQLFQNITLSMLSTPSLIMNNTIAQQNEVPVSITTSVNVYAYSPPDLWLAYGIACGASFVATLLGLLAMWRNGGVGYQSIFSTFIRMTRDQALQELIEPADRGEEPLPKKLAEARVGLRTQGSERMGWI